MDVVALFSSYFIRNKKSREVKVVAVLDYTFHGSCRKVSKVLSMALEPISKSAVYYLAKKYLKSESLRSLGIGCV
jgi:hypothetical protein